MVIAHRFGLPSLSPFVLRWPRTPGRLVSLFWRCLGAGRCGGWPDANVGEGRDGVLVLSIVVAAVASVVPLLLALSRDVGLAHAGAFGAVDPLSFPWVVLGIVCTTLLAKRTWVGVLPAATIGMGAVSALVIAQRSNAALSDYYPAKMLWLSAVLGVPAVWALGVWGVGDFGGLTAVPARVARSAVGTLVLTLLVVDLMTPAATLVQAAVMSDAKRVLTAATSTGADRTQVVWRATDTATLDVFVRILIDFYSPSRSATPVAELSVAEECKLLRSARIPSVLTTRTPGQAASRYGCVSGVQTIPVVGSPPGRADLP